MALVVVVLRGGAGHHVRVGGGRRMVVVFRVAATLHGAQTLMHFQGRRVVANNADSVVRRLMEQARAERLAKKPENIARHPALVEALAKRGRVWGQGYLPSEQIAELRKAWQEREAQQYPTHGGPGWTQEMAQRNGVTKRGTRRTNRRLRLSLDVRRREEV